MGRLHQVDLLPCIEFAVEGPQTTMARPRALPVAQSPKPLLRGLARHATAALEAHRVRVAPRVGRVLYDLADFGLDAGTLRERFRFYTDRFPVRLEQ